MTKDLIIVGASGFGREVAWLVERINRVRPTWNLLGFADDNDDKQGTVINGYRVLGKTDDLVKRNNAYYVCAVGASTVREAIVCKMINKNPNIKFGTLIDPTVLLSDTVTIGEGTVICAQTILTVNIDIGKHVIINLDCTIGHDAILSDFATLYPSVNVSGNVKIGCCSELGTGLQIIQGATIGNHSIVGAGSVVIKDIPDNCTAIGNYAKPIKYYEQ